MEGSSVVDLFIPDQFFGMLMEGEAQRQCWLSGGTALLPPGVQMEISNTWEWAALVNDWKSWKSCSVQIQAPACLGRLSPWSVLLPHGVCTGQLGRNPK